MAKDLSEFGWGRVTDENSVTGVSQLIFYRDEGNKPCHALKADIGGGRAGVYRQKRKRLVAQRWGS